MSHKKYRFHVVGTANFPDCALVSFHGLTGGEPVGVTDIRFPSPGWLLRKTWPGLRYNSDVPPSLLTGERLTDELAARLPPIRVELRKPLAARRAFPAQLPDWLVVAGAPVVSRRVMNVIDALEPGRHQFFPTEFEAWDDRQPLYENERYGYLNVLNWIAPDALYDLDAMGGCPAAVSHEVKFGPEAAEEFSGPVTASHISLDNHVFSNWLVRSDWIASGHLIMTGTYWKARFTSVTAASLVLLSDDLLERFKQDLPPDAIATRAINVSRR